MIKFGIFGLVISIFWIFCMLKSMNREELYLVNNKCGNHPNYPTMRGQFIIIFVVIAIISFISLTIGLWNYF